MCPTFKWVEEERIKTRNGFRGIYYVLGFLLISSFNSQEIPLKWLLVNAFHT